MKRVLPLVMLIFICGCESQPAQGPQTITVKESAQQKPEAAQTKAVRPAVGDTVRPMAAAGRFYPADALVLRSTVEGYIGSAGKVEVTGEVVALIAPHAGYVFSGPVAGYSYAVVEGKSFDTVVVVGGHSPGAKASVLDLDYYQTPLGHVKMDREAAKALLGKREFSYEPARHGEHAIEVQVPFLQVALQGNFKIVVVAATNCDIGFVKRVAKALAETLKGRKVLLVASTDLSHYPPYDSAKVVDGKIMEEWKTLDGARIVKREEALMLEYAQVPNLGCVMCGKAAVAIVVEAAKLLGADSIDLLKYANSGDVPAGSKDGVVGYGAATIYKKGKKAESGELSKEAQKCLLKVARDAITAAVNKLDVFWDKATSEELKAKRGVFVTLYKNGRLRGCIGCFASDGDLPSTVAKYAALSATRDSRFRPVRPEEMSQIKIKISVLSEPKKVKSVDEIVVGRHGIWIRDPKSGRGGTYLPEVATEMGWDRDTFLTDCCIHKAHLPGDAWKKEQVDIYTYTTQVFGED